MVPRRFKEHEQRDPLPVINQQLLDAGLTQKDIDAIDTKTVKLVQADYERALLAQDPTPEDLYTHDFAPTPITEEKVKEHQKAKKKQ